MSKTWLVARSTYKRGVRSGTFLILTFLLPVIMVAAGAIPVLMSRSRELPTLGYVDESGQLATVNEVAVGEGTLHATRYAADSEARAAFARGEIAGYLLVPAGYLQGEQVRFFADREPSATLQGALAALLRHALAPDAPEWLFRRLENPASVTYVALEQDVTLTEGPALALRIAFPVALALLFAFIVFTGAGQMGSAVVREKEQRSMEMIITSISVRQLVMGNVLGMVLLSLTQMAVWVLGAIAALALVLTRQGGGVQLSLPWEALVWGLLLGIPGYLLYAVLSAGLGIIAGDRQQAQQLAGVLGFLGLFPFWFVGTLITAPNSPLAVALTLFPLTAPMFALLRMALAGVPTWQLLLSLAILVLSVLASIWFVARIFRSAMLIYGQSLRPQDIWRALRQAS